jgi:hypothetical protein
VAIMPRAISRIGGGVYFKSSFTVFSMPMSLFCFPPDFFLNCLPEKSLASGLLSGTCERHHPHRSRSPLPSRCAPRPSHVTPHHLGVARSIHFLPP